MMIPNTVRDALLNAKCYLDYISWACYKIGKNYVGEEKVENIVDSLNHRIELIDKLGYIDREGYTEVSPIHADYYTWIVTKNGKLVNDCIDILKSYTDNNPNDPVSILLNDLWYDGLHHIDFEKINEVEEYDWYRERILREKIQELDIYNSHICYVGICGTKYDKDEEGSLFKKGYLEVEFKCLDYTFFLEVVNKEDCVEYNLVNIRHPHGWQSWKLSDKAWKTLVHYGTPEFEKLEKDLYDIFEKKYQRSLKAGYLP